MGTLTNLFRSVVGGSSGVVLPGGRTVEKWREEVEATWPAGYATTIAMHRAYLANQVRADTRAELKRRFPTSADDLSIATLALYPAVIDAQAQVFAGEPRIDLVDSNGATREAAGKTFADVAKASGLGLKLVELDRATRALRRVFVRLGWDDDTGTPTLHRFAPHDVWPLFEGDFGPLESAAGVLLRLAPRGKVQRYEFWTAQGDAPGWMRFSSDGKVEAEGALEYERAGKPALPLMTFSEGDPDDGWYQPPADTLLDAARAVNCAWTQLLDTTQKQSFGQWIGKADSEQSPPLAAEVPFGPGRILAARGWTFSHVAQQASLVEAKDTINAYLLQLAVLERVPARAVLTASTSAPSGYALTIERMPLAELRGERVQRLTPATLELIEKVRMVYDAHQSSNAARFGESVAVFEAAALTVPSDPQSEATIAQTRVNTDRQAIANGTLSPARILMRDEGLSEDDAKAEVEAIAEENGPRRTMANVAGSLAAGLDPKAAPQAAKPVAGGGAAVTVPAEAPAADTALNGAQVTSLLDVLVRVQDGTLPRESARAVIEVAFRLTPDAANKMLSPLKPGSITDATPTR